MLTLLKRGCISNRRLTAHIQQRGFQQPSRLVTDLKKAQSLTAPPNPLKKVVEHEGHYANRLPDFDVGMSGVGQELESMALPEAVAVPEGYEREHPFEKSTKESRIASDVFGRMKDNQLVFTNLPRDSAEFSSPAQVKELLLNQVHKDLDIGEIRFLPALTTSEQPARWAYVLVTLGSKRQAHLVKTKLRKHWFGDQPLKVKVADDAKREHFDKRTIVLQDIPTNLTQKQILETFVSDYAVVNLELPVENIALGEYARKKKIEDMSVESSYRREKNFNLAKKAIHQSLQLDQDYQNTISAQLGNETLSMVINSERQAVDVLDQEKFQSLSRMITRLQAEGVQVLEHRKDLLNLRESMVSPSVQSVDESDFKSKLEANRANIETIMRYLRTNQDSTEYARFESLQQLLTLGKQELAVAYDKMIANLDHREQLIEKRIVQSLQHFGIDERVLVEGKNYDLEMEDIAQTDIDRIKPEELISVNDQINYVLQKKHMTPMTKYKLLFSKVLNPFVGKPLWNDRNLKHAEHPQLDKKHTNPPDPRLARSLMLKWYQGQEFTQESHKEVWDLINDLQGNYQVPFDELYHKEKGLVQAVIEADKALKAKEKQLESLLADGLITAQEAAQLCPDSLNLQNKDLFQLGKQREEARLNKQNVDDAASTGYEFQQQKQHKLREMLESGVITQSEYDLRVTADREMEEKNLGYAFITLSHSDEARIMMLSNPNPYYRGRKYGIDLKSNMDHGDLDPEFYMKRGRNEARLVDEIKALRDAKQELRDFESNMKEHLPSRKKLTDFNNLAKRVIEGKTRSAHVHPTDQRTQLEEERLRAKVAELEKKYPHVDLSQIFDSEQAEDARKALHRSAFQSYKAHEFLKHGINQPAEKPAELSEAKRRLRDNDPYNFPELDDTVSKVLSSDIMTPTVIDHGDAINTPGRRFNGYSEREFLDAYFGKDFMRAQVVDRSQNPMWVTQKTIQERYPLSDFLMKPNIEPMHERAKEWGVVPNYKSVDMERINPKFPDADFDRFARMMHAQESENANLHTKAHPEHPERNYMKDLDSMLTKYMAERERRGFGDTYNFNDINKMRAQLNEEYKEMEPDWFKGLQRGKYKRPSNTPGFLPKENAAGELEEGQSEAQDAKFQTNYQRQRKDRPTSKETNEKKEELPVEDNGPMDPRHVDANRDFIYNQRVRPLLYDKKLSKAFEDKAHENNLNYNDLLKDIAKDGKLDIAERRYGGKWLDNLEGGVLNDANQAETSHKVGKSLDSFIEGQSEEHDVYEWYQSQLNNREKTQEQTRQSEPVDPSLLNPDMPRFEDYFETTAKGLHPFDSITDKVNESLEGKFEMSELEQKEERELYRRELVGRLIGERLTPRQFELISGDYRTSHEKCQFVKGAENDAFLDRRDTIRLHNELIEQGRKRKVINGEWTEQESHQKIKELVEEAIAITPKPLQTKRLRKDIDDYLHDFHTLDSPERMMLKEYHFDESLGQSLADHCDELKQRYPGIQVLVRRDRDGFPIIRTKFEPEYKYNITDMENFNQDEAETSMNETVEAVMNLMYPKEPQEIIEDVAASMEHTVNILNGQQENRYDLDSFTKLAVMDLVKQKVSGSLDNDQLLEKLVQISENAGFDESKPLAPFQNGDAGADVQVEFLADRHQMREEIHRQLTSRINKHTRLTKREHSDYVRPRVDEVHALHNQVTAHDSSIGELERQTAEVDQKAENFDMDAFTKMKEEIRRRKEAKERLLTQGMPEFSSYLRF